MRFRKAGALPLITRRLVIREILGTDLSALKLLAADRRLAGLLPRQMRALATAEKLADQPMKQRRDARSVECVVTLQRTGKLIGACELVAGNRNSADIGYMLDPRHWGYGYGTELVNAVCALAFDSLGTRKLTAFVSVDNERSRRVLEKTGFLWEGLVRRHTRIGGRWLDCHYFAQDRPRRTRGRTRG
jgi:RimJ/RimL family protein N-acetyltransferase